MDVLNPQQRSRCMSRIRGRDTKPELVLRNALWTAGLRYRIKNKLPGRPDIVFPGKRVAVFVDGCFWHKCPEHFQNPRQNAKFWADKIDGNVRRDKAVDEKLKTMGWLVVRTWEHEVRKSPEKCVSRIQKLLKTTPDS